MACVRVCVCVTLAPQVCTQRDIYPNPPAPASRLVLFIFPLFWRERLRVRTHQQYAMLTNKTRMQFCMGARAPDVLVNGK